MPIKKRYRKPKIRTVREEQKNPRPIFVGEAREVVAFELRRLIKKYNRAKTEKTRKKLKKIIDKLAPKAGLSFVFDGKKIRIVRL